MIRQHTFYLLYLIPWPLRYLTIILEACFIRCASQHAYNRFLSNALAIGYLSIIQKACFFRCASQHAYNLFLSNALAL